MERPDAERFVVLDSWRGIAACLVALFHFEVFGHLLGVPFVRNAYLMVDFFFVLSGFVIAANYQQRLLDGFGVGRFMLLRLGRLYPLHFTMLALGVALKLVQLAVPASTSIAQGPAPFSAPDEAPNTILANLLLVQSLHLYDFFTWTAQSWSISTEFYTYLVFAACLVGLRRRAWIALPVALIAGPVLVATLSRHNMDTNMQWGIVRCLYGFAAGVACWATYRRWGAVLRKWLSGDLAEWCAAGLMFAFVSAAGTTLLSVAAPYVFALVVLVFAFGTGTLSAFLRQRPLVFLGTISYSIYMTHIFIERRILDAGRVFGRLLHVDPFTHIAEPVANGRSLDLLGTQLWHGDLATLVSMAMVIVVSTVTYRWIEKPGRQWVRDWVRKRHPPVAGIAVESYSVERPAHHPP